jgi:urea transport system substrate-binding protein
MKERIKELGGEVVREEYRILGSKNFTEIVDKIIEIQPDIILNTINGDSNLWFFKELRLRGISPQEIPTISFSIAENEIELIGAKNMVGDYASWNYFQSLNTKENQKFVNSFKAKYGSDRLTDDPMEAGYIGVYLFAKAAELANSDDPRLIRQAIKGITLAAPEGIIGVDPKTQHTLKVVRIGQILENGQFKIIASSEAPIMPQPYPDYKSKEQWDSFLNTLYTSWDNNWSNLNEEVTEVQLVEKND